MFSGVPKVLVTNRLVASEEAGDDPVAGGTTCIGFWRDRLADRRGRWAAWEAAKKQTKRRTSR